MKEPSRLKIEAHHEAGHVLAAFLLGLPVSWATLGRHDADNGDPVTDLAVPLARWEAVFKSQSPEPDVITTRWKALMFKMAGSAAEVLLLGQRSVFGGSLDTESAEDLLQRCIPDADLRTRYLAELRLAAIQLLAEPPHWKAVQAVAEKLLANRGRRVGRLVLHRIIAEAVGQVPWRPRGAIRAPAFSTTRAPDCLPGVLLEKIEGGKE